MKPKINPFWGYLTLALVILSLVLCIVGAKKGTLSVRTDADPASVNAFPCVVRDSVFLGETTVLTLESSGVTLHASEGAAPERIPGASIFCAVPPDAFTILPPETR